MDIRRLDLNLLLLLDGLHRQRSLTMVARRLGMSQSMASTNLRKLRAFFADELYLSTGRGMRATPFAESIAEAVTQVLGIVDRDILRKPVFVPETSDRVFSISTSDIGVLIFVPPLLRRLQELAPGTSLRCIDVPRDRLESVLEAGDLDLAIGYFPDLSEPSVASELLFDHPFVCLVRSEHPKVGGELTLEQFLTLDHLVIQQTGRGQEIFEHRMRELRLERHVLLEVGHYLNVPQLIANSDMIATVPLSLGAWYADRGIRLLRPPIDIPLITLKQYWHRRTQEDPAIRWFRSVVTEELRGRDPSLALSADYARMFPSAA